MRTNPFGSGKRPAAPGWKRHNIRKEPLHQMQRLFPFIILAAAYSPTDTLCSTIGDGALNFRVRHGTGCVHPSITTRNFYIASGLSLSTCPQVNKDFMRLRPRRISTGRLKGLSPLTSPAYQSGRLPDALLACAMGYLISGPVSRLDAFSGYPIRTWLPGFCSWRNNRYTSGPSIPVLSY